VTDRGAAVAADDRPVAFLAFGFATFFADFLAALLAIARVDVRPALFLAVLAFDFLAIPEVPFDG
jgi:hypothetical protein